MQFYRVDEIACSTQEEGKQHNTIQNSVHQLNPVGIMDSTEPRSSAEFTTQGTNLRFREERERE